MAQTLNPSRARSPLRRAAREGTLTDGLLLCAVLLSAVLWGDGSISHLRTVTTVLALCVAPGWAVLRATGSRATMRTVVVAIAISCSATMVLALLLVTRLDWQWPAGVVALYLVSGCGLVLSLTRPARGRLLSLSRAVAARRPQLPRREPSPNAPRRYAAEPTRPLGHVLPDGLILVPRPVLVSHIGFDDLPSGPQPGGLVVVTSALSLVAPLEGFRRGRIVSVRLSAELDDGTWAVQLSHPGRAGAALSDLGRGESVELPGGHLVVVEPYPQPDADPRRTRLWRCRLAVPGRAPDHPWRHGRPVAPRRGTPPRRPVADAPLTELGLAGPLAAMPLEAAYRPRRPGGTARQLPG